MCNTCIIDNVKASMLSRRSILARSAAAGVAAVAAGLVTARQSLANGGGQAVDLTYGYDGNFPTYGGTPGITTEKVADFAKDGYTVLKLTIIEHTGTHIDAPLHFTADNTSVDNLLPENLVCPLCVIDIKEKAKGNANAMVEKADIEAWVSANGDIPQGACVAMNSGWGAKMGTPEFRNTPDNALAFPGFAKEATDMLAEMGVASIGVDTLSLDPGNSQDFAVHYSWLPSGRYGIENMANLDMVPAKGATVFVGAPKHKGGTGGPARVMAVI